MNYGKNTRKYLDLVLRVENSFSDLDDTKTKKEFGEAVRNIIFDIDGRRTISKKPGKKELFHAKRIFRPLSEVLNSFESIQNISVYIRSFPYKRQGISEVNYLRYHIENYLNELYILKLRLERYLKTLSRAYKRTKWKDQINKIVEKLNSYVQQAFEVSINARGYHIHEYRYTDDDLDRLSTLNLYSNASDEKLANIAKSLFGSAYRDIRKKWVKKIESDMKGIHDLLELYFKGLTPIISENGKIIYPFDQ